LENLPFITTVHHGHAELLSAAYWPIFGRQRKRSDHQTTAILTHKDGNLGESSQLEPPVILEVVPGTGILRASFDPTQSPVRPNLATFKQALQTGGYDEYYLDDAAIDSFILNCAAAVESVVADIGGRRNASFSVEISEDLMSAWLTLSPAQGGNPVGVQVHDALRDKGIIFGIAHAELNAALARGWCDHALVAQGEPPVSGAAGRFEVLFGLDDKATQTINENAKVRFSDLSHLLLVHANDPLMRIYPPVQGKAGKDIKGQIVPAQMLPDLKFGVDLQGSTQDRSDPNLLVALHAGQPVQVKDGVIVNPVISVQHVDLSTGKIQFEGTVHVEGDVKAGMSVNVSGDVIVNGMVESAEIIAGGNVAVKGGVIGRAEKKAGTQQLADTAAKIKCAGSVQALFMENVHVEAGNSIELEQNARQCELIARNEINVGKSGAKGGQIIGGHAQAAMMIQADVIGTNVATKTTIQVGVDPYLEEQISKKQNIINRKIADLDQVLKLIVYFERNPQKNIDGVANKVEEKRVQQLLEIDLLTQEMTDLAAQLELIEKACVKVGKIIHDGVEIQIGKQVWQVREETGGGVYRLRDGVIVLV